MEAWSAAANSSKSVADFVRWINPAAQANTLGQLLLKLTSPGVPDIYQGTEFLDLSLVDPDNRRSVDFAARMRALAEPEEHLESTKLEILRAALALRGRQPDLFARGRYHPLAVEGAKSSNVLAYGRVDGERVAITVITRLLGSELVRVGTSVLEASAWGDTMIVLPRDWHRLPWRRSSEPCGSRDRRRTPDGVTDTRSYSGGTGGHRLDRAYTSARRCSRRVACHVSSNVRASSIALLCRSSSAMESAASAHSRTTEWLRRST